MSSFIFPGPGLPFLLSYGMLLSTQEIWSSSQQTLYDTSYMQLFLFLTSMIMIKGQTITNTAQNTKRSTTSGHKSSTTIELCNYSGSISILREPLGKNIT